MATAARQRGGQLAQRRPMPTGDIPGWRQVFAEDFNTDVAVGGFVPKTNSPGSGGLTQGGAADAPYGGKLAVYPSGFGAGDIGKSRPEQVLSVSDSCLVYNFTVNTAGEYTAATVQLLIGSFVGPGSSWPGYYQDPAVGLRLEFKFRVESAPMLGGWGGVAFLNPSNEDWSARRGEMDAIEGSLSQNMETNWHPWKTYVAGDGAPRWGSQPYGNGVDHICVVEWWPVGNTVEPTGLERVTIDGNVIGQTRTMVAQDPRKAFVFQTGVNSAPPAAGAVAPGGGVYPANGTTRGRLMIDYITAYYPTTNPTASGTTAARMKGGSLRVGGATAARMKGGGLFVTPPAGTQGPGRYRYANGVWVPVVRNRYNAAPHTWKPMPYGTLS